MNTAFQAGHVPPGAPSTEALPSNRRFDAGHERVVDMQKSGQTPKATGERLATAMHRTLLKAAIVAALCGPCPPAFAALAQEALAFNIPSGPLSSTLIEIGKRSGTLVSFSPSLVEGEVAAPVQGQYTPMQAFMQALSASGLSINVTPNGTVTVYPTHAAKTGMSTSERLVPADDGMARPTEAPRQGTSQAAPFHTLDPVLVLASADASPPESLRASTASAATRIDTPLSELPQSVSVVTRDALDLQGPHVTSIEALRYVNGVTDEGSRMLPSLMVRGLPAQYLLSGMGTLRGQRAVNSVFIDRIEVLKGPTGAIGGISNFGGRGGVINLVRKSIEPQPFVEVKQSFSSRDSGIVRTDLDAAGALAPGTYWRAAAFGSRSGHTDGGYDPERSAALLGVLGYRGTDFKATLTLQTDRQRIRPDATSRGGMPREDGGFTAVEPGQAGTIDTTDSLHLRSTDIELDLSWQLSPQWRMTWKGRQERLGGDLSQHLYRTALGDEAAGVDLERSKIDAQSASMQWGLIGDLATGPIKHRLLMALDVDRGHLQIRDGVDIWEVDPATFEPGVTPLPATPDSANSQTTSSRKLEHAVLVQDQVRLGNWIAQLAAQRSHSSGAEDANGVSLDEPKVTNWDAGLLYQITPTVSVYAGTQYSVEVDLQRSDVQLYDGTEIPLRELRQTQAGTKIDLLERRLALTLEAFRLRQRTKLQRSDELPGSGVFTVPGRSVNGVEAELAGRVSPALDILLGLNVIRARDVVMGPDPAVPQGVESPATGLPERSMFLLGRYRLPGAGPMRNSLGLGFRAYSSSWVVPPDPAGDPSGLRLPGGAQFDVSWTRTAQRWSLRLSIDNLFNRQLYGTQSAPGHIPLQPGRSVGITATFMH
jgi:iron complex outermembrane receptor protein